MWARCSFSSGQIPILMPFLTMLPPSHVPRAETAMSKTQPGHIPYHCLSRLPHLCMWTKAPTRSVSGCQLSLPLFIRTFSFGQVLP
jgi:hypothetical protein